VLEAGKLRQGHNDAFKKVTAPTGVAVVSMKQGFRPSPAVNPQDHRIRRKELPLAYCRREASRNLPSVEQEVLPTEPPWPPQRNWTVEVQAATPPGIRDSGRLHHLPAWDQRRRPPKLVDHPRLLRHQGTFLHQRRSRGPLGPSRPRSGPVAKRRHQHPAASTRSSLPSVPPTRRRGGSS
jgi:hypothetical protein